MSTEVERIAKAAQDALNRAGRDRRTKVAAGVAVAGGAALAAARALRSADSGGPPRAYVLKRGEKPARGIRRIASGRAADATEHLRGEIDEPRSEAIHEARKDLKKLRAVLRLVRDRVGDDVYRRENTRFRDAGRLLAGARDAEVKLATLESLFDRDGAEADRRDGAEPDSGLDVGPLADALAAERDALAVADPGDGTDQATAKAIAAIEIGGAAIDEWPLKRGGWKLVRDGLARSYRRGRRGFAAAEAEFCDENVHEWRKRVKDLWYHLRILRDANREVLEPAADEAHRLSELLGDHHDLAVLRDDVRGRDGLAGDADRAAILARIERRQSELRGPAVELARTVYAEKPKAFVDRIGAYWKDWRSS